MRFNVAAAQIKPKKADDAHNLAKVADLFEQIESMDPRPDVLVLPETAMSGYFLEGGVRDVARSRDDLFNDLLAVYRQRTRGGALDIAVGFYELHEGKYYNAGLYATLAHDDSAQINHVHHKFFLATYGVFDEKRFVARGRTVDAFDTRFGRAAVLICEDIWHSITGMLAALDGAQIVYVISASPGRDFTGDHLGNLERYSRLIPSIADEHSVWVVYSGLVGFEGGKGFTGSSRIVDPWGRTLAIGSPIDECVVAAEVDLEDVAVARASSPLLADLEAALPDVALALETIARRPHTEDGQ